MSLKQTDPQSNEDKARKSRDIITREVNQLHDLLDETEANTLKRIDVLEDMLDILNER
jgi:hypothetical protein